jgi:ATP-dependent Lon protease
MDFDATHDMVTQKDVDKAKMFITKMLETLSLKHAALKEIEEDNQENEMHIRRTLFVLKKHIAEVEANIAKMSNDKSEKIHKQYMNLCQLEKIGKDLKTSLNLNSTPAVLRKYSDFKSDMKVLKLNMFPQESRKFKLEIEKGDIYVHIVPPSVSYRL